MYHCHNLSKPKFDLGGILMKPKFLKSKKTKHTYLSKPSFLNTVDFNSELYYHLVLKKYL
jgi:hypothetical protein